MTTYIFSRVIYLFINTAANRNLTSSRPIDDRRSHRQRKHMHSGPRRTAVPPRGYSAKDCL
ncbi:hypothetical protein Q5689_17435 [Microcoleus sp. ARI1-A2]|uniref:hypothetical protein n=1 Tax=unclassified Microcoleus TaxID=2642155 RepID=UPI002FD75E41